MKKLIVLIGAIASASVFAEDGGTTATNLAPIGKAICIALAAFGAASGQGRAAATALEGIARNPSSADKLQTPLILSLAFMEALAILAFVIALGIN